MTLNRISSDALTRSNLIEQYRQTPEHRRAGRLDQAGFGSESEANPAVADQADISPQAHKQQALQRLLEVGQAAAGREPDVRASKLAQVRMRLDEGFYESAEVRDQVAGRLRDLFLQQGLF